MAALAVGLVVGGGAVALAILAPGGEQRLAALGGWPALLTALAAGALMLALLLAVVASRQAARARAEVRRLTEALADLERAIAQLQRPPAEARPVAAARRAILPEPPTAATIRPTEPAAPVAAAAVPAPVMVSAADEPAPPQARAAPEAGETWFEPILALPGRETLHLLAVRHGAPGRRDAAGEAADAAAGLEDCLRLARELLREGHVCGVIWRCDAMLTADATTFGACERLLEANLICNRRLTLLVHRATLGAPGAGTRLRDLGALGFPVGLDDPQDREAILAAARIGVRLVLVPAAGLLAMLRRDEGGNRLAQAAGAAGITLAATGVTDDASVLELIDNDVTAASGPLFSPPRPLRRR